MIQLGVNYCAELVTLAQDPDINFQYVKVGDWLEQSIPYAMAQFPDKTLLYHCNSLIQHDSAGTQALVTTLHHWQQRTGCPWLSAHLDQYTLEETRAYFHDGRPLPEYSEVAAFDLICSKVEAIKPHLAVPLLLENMPHWPTSDPDPATSSNFITRVLDETQCDLLLDLAHARISAENLGRDVYAYLEELPLEQVVEIHVSGPRYENGWWHDYHDTLQAEDYALLEWVLWRSAPRVVTMEYWKDIAQVRAQLLRLSQLTARADQWNTGNRPNCERNWAG
ncbi:MAG: DUF692 family multinuclear iron-containing protein [Chloroflexota bacterium]